MTAPERRCWRTWLVVHIVGFAVAVGTVARAFVPPSVALVVAMGFLVPPAAWWLTQWCLHWARSASRDPRRPSPS